MLWLNRLWAWGGKKDSIVVDVGVPMPIETSLHKINIIQESLNNPQDKGMQYLLEKFMISFQADVCKELDAKGKEYGSDDICAAIEARLKPMGLVFDFNKEKYDEIFEMMDERIEFFVDKVNKLQFKLKTHELARQCYRTTIAYSALYAYVYNNYQNYCLEQINTEKPQWAIDEIIAAGKKGESWSARSLILLAQDGNEEAFAILKQFTEGHNKTTQEQAIRFFVLQAFLNENIQQFIYESAKKGQDWAITALQDCAQGNLGEYMSHSSEKPMAIMLVYEGKQDWAYDAIFDLSIDSIHHKWASDFIRDNPEISVSEEEVDGELQVSRIDPRIFGLQPPVGPKISVVDTGPVLASPVVGF